MMIKGHSPYNTTLATRLDTMGAETPQLSISVYTWINCVFLVSHCGFWYSSKLVVLALQSRGGVVTVGPPVGSCTSQSKAPVDTRYCVSVDIFRALVTVFCLYLATNR